LRKGFAFPWSFYIYHAAAAERKGEAFPQEPAAEPLSESKSFTKNLVKKPHFTVRLHDHVKVHEYVKRVRSHIILIVSVDVARGR
jgi:hypothetical protein